MTEITFPNAAGGGANQSTVSSLERGPLLSRWSREKEKKRRMAPGAANARGPGGPQGQNEKPVLTHGTTASICMSTNSVDAAGGVCHKAQ